ncbi:MAG TPA: hypothetical protein VLA96_07595, partial [Terriglobales bacterium]|nr:hypothetical protein [Terriglobales bacterium]
SLAGAVFVALHYVIGAAWSTAVRRVAEAMALLLPLGGLGVLVVLFFHPEVYPWLHKHDLPAFKQAWLALGFFRARAIFYLLAWTFFIWMLVLGSRRQDEDGDLAHTRRNTRFATAFLIVFGVTFWLASYDWLMSLEPDWASTLYGMYNFAGMFLAGLAVLALLVIHLQQRRPLADALAPHHLHDLGKLVFAISTFWMYLWFSQYMLIWYANIPEETIYFVRRWQGFWGPLFLLNVALNWVVPFLVLLPRTHKQKPGVLGKVCWVVLAGRFLDLWLMVAPPSQPGRPQVGLLEAGLALLTAGVFGLSFFAVFRRAPALPVRDPRLAESLHPHG